eukprot:gene11917-biopygen232
MLVARTIHVPTVGLPTAEAATAFCEDLRAADKTSGCGAKVVSSPKCIPQLHCRWVVGKVVDRPEGQTQNTAVVDGAKVVEVDSFFHSYI